MFLVAIKLFSDDVCPAVMKCCLALILKVRLMGCQDLLEEVPGRSRRDKDSISSPSGDLRSFVKGVTGRSSSKSYSIKDETSSKCRPYTQSLSF